MSSTHYGERWAQKELDVVRYADTNGFEGDGERKNAWRYRDYVVKAFNSDKPYEVDPWHIRDFHATILHAMGLDQHKLWYLHNGRHEKLTDFGGKVIQPVFA